MLHFAKSDGEEEEPSAAYKFDDAELVHVYENYGFNFPLNDLKVKNNRMMVGFRNKTITKDLVTIAVYDTDQETSNLFSSNERVNKVMNYKKTKGAFVATTFMKGGYISLNMTEGDDYSYGFYTDSFGAT